MEEMPSLRAKILSAKVGAIFLQDEAPRLQVALVGSIPSADANHRARRSEEVSVSMWCVAHLRRAGEKVEAAHLIEDEAFCEKCFRGEPIDRELEQSGAGNGQPANREDRAPGQQAGYQAAYYRKHRGATVRREAERRETRRIARAEA